MIDKDIKAVRDNARDGFDLSLRVQLRRCAKEDLAKLEWEGVFAHDRAIFLDTFDRQQNGEALMILAECNAYPIGQIWIDFEKRKEFGAGYLWAFRVLPAFQRLGIGKWLLSRAEAVLERREFLFAELHVEKWNTQALRLYQKIGYQITGPDGAPSDHESMPGELPSLVNSGGFDPAQTNTQWLLRKRLISRNSVVTRRIPRIDPD